LFTQKQKVDHVLHKKQADKEPKSQIDFADAEKEKRSTRKE